MHRPSHHHLLYLLFPGAVLAVLLLAGGAATPAVAAVTVAVERPLDGDILASPITVSATATTSATNARVTGWHVYVDGVLAYGAGGPAAAMSASVAMDDGAHELIVRAWDSTGDYSSATLTVTIGVCSGFTVDLQSPAAGSVASPVEVTAVASSCHRVTGFAVYVDGRRVHEQPGPSSLDATLDLPAGHHEVQVRAVDSTRATAGSDTVPIDVEAKVTAPPPRRQRPPQPSPPSPPPARRE